MTKSEAEKAGNKIQIFFFLNSYGIWEWLTNMEASTLETKEGETNFISWGHH